MITSSYFPEKFSSEQDTVAWMTMFLGVYFGFFPFGYFGKAPSGSMFLVTCFWQQRLPTSFRAFGLHVFIPPPLILLHH